jgi:hypothetical protein
VVYSHSGRNAAGIETALYAQKRGLAVVDVTSTKMLEKPPTHSSGKRLADAADIVIDTCAPVEDAIVKIPGMEPPRRGLLHSNGDGPDPRTDSPHGCFVGRTRDRTANFRLSYCAGSNPA